MVVLRWAVLPPPPQRPSLPPLTGKRPQLERGMLVHSGKSDGKKQHFGNEHAHSVTWALVSVRVGTRGEDAAAVWEGDCTGEFGGRRMCVCVCVCVRVACTHTGVGSGHTKSGHKVLKQCARVTNPHGSAPVDCGGGVECR